MNAHAPITPDLPADHQIGANMPPEPIVEVATDPIDALTVHAKDLRVEVGNWCDGAKVENAAQAEVVERLLEDVKAAIAAVELAREGEIKPLTDRVTKLREKYYPLVGETKKITGTLIMMKTKLLEVKSDWGNRENARIAREAAEARAAQAKAAQEAADALRAAQGDIEKAEQAEVAVHAAQAQLQTVHQIEAGAVKGMRDNWRVKGFAPVTDPITGAVTDGDTALLRHYWTTNKDALVAAALEIARADVRMGRRSIPGLVIENDRRAV